ncbi:MAG: lipopolysaccharide heptosyltransferase II [Simkaniaceae bacterium]|nr:lipopolysaccharide heptosyltransferase II [Simkaniaceae bacterium]
MDQPNNIVVRMPNWIGDIVMATPVLADLRAAFPSAQITAMCMHPFAHILDRDPAVDEVFCFRKVRGSVRRDAKRNITEKLKAGGYDLGVILTNSFSSAWWFYQANINRRIGFAGNLRSPLLTDAIAFPENRKEQHLVKTYKALLQPLGIEQSETPPKLFVDEHETQAARALLKTFGINEGETIVGINPCAAFGSAKCWLPERFREVARHLAEEKKVRVLFFGAGDCNDLVKSICAGLPAEVVNLAGMTSVRELMAITSLCSLFITNDSGPMHIADALEIPLIAIFGSTSDVATGPYNQKRVLRKSVSCSPCFKRKCPIDFRCMTGISVDDVLNQVSKVLN